MMARYSLFVCLLVFALSSGVSAQVRARVSGLEDNEEYMALMDRETKLHAAEDSITKRIESVRKAFASEGTNRDSLGRVILSLEEQLFDVRDNVGKVVNSISSIEQQFLMSSLGRGSGNTTGTSATTRSFEEFLQRNLPEEDYGQLKTLRSQENELKTLAGKYWDNYGRMSKLSAVYDTAAEAEADSVLMLVDSLRVRNQEIEEQFIEVWEPVYDGKLYAYTYLLDHLRENSSLAEMERKLMDVNERSASIYGKVESEVLAEYVLRNDFLLAYEKKLAELCDDTAAIRSGTDKIAANSKSGYDKPPFGIKRRNFIEYEDAKFSSPSIYNASNPIPREKVRDHGTVYKVDVGVFTRPQAVSIFRGVSPLTYDILDDGRYVYYVGAYRTSAEAADAVAELKKRGFRRTEVVVWNDGVREEIDLSQASGSGFYRVEILGMGEAIDPAVRQAIEEVAPGKEISRVVGDDGKFLYIVGSFNGYDLAEEVVEAVKDASDFEVRIIPVE